jgi:hypothetical protein
MIFKILSAKKLAFLPQNKAILCMQKFDHDIGI